MLIRGAYHIRFIFSPQAVPNRVCSKLKLELAPSLNSQQQAKSMNSEPGAPWLAKFTPCNREMPVSVIVLISRSC